MATNKFFNRRHNPIEQKTFSNILRKLVYDQGEDVHYIPRNILEEDDILGEVTNSIFDKFIEIEALVPNLGEDDGSTLLESYGIFNDLGTKILIHRERFKEEISRHGLDTEQYFEPLAGDLFYIGRGENTFVNSLYEIVSCGEPSGAKFQFGKLLMFEVKLKAFRYNYEDFDTGYEVIDNMMKDFSNDNVISGALNNQAKMKVDDIIIDVNDPLKDTI